jgi:hypothetical protein
LGSCKSKEPVPEDTTSKVEAMSGVEVEAMLGVKATSDVEAVFEMEDR